VSGTWVDLDLFDWLPSRSEAVGSISLGRTNPLDFVDPQLCFELRFRVHLENHDSAYAPVGALGIISDFADNTVFRLCMGHFNNKKWLYLARQSVARSMDSPVWVICCVRPLGLLGKCQVDP